MQYLINDIQELDAVADAIVKSIANGSRRILFKGKMGAGKTTLIKIITEKLGVKDKVTSPTFAIVNEYLSDKGKIFHFDCYRLKSKEEFFDLGYEDYLYSDAVCFIEWPELVIDLIPLPVVNVNIDEQGGLRHIRVD